MGGGEAEQREGDSLVDSIIVASSLLDFMNTVYKDETTGRPNMEVWKGDEKVAEFIQKKTQSWCVLYKQNGVIKLKFKLGGTQIFSCKTIVCEM